MSLSRIAKQIGLIGLMMFGVTGSALADQPREWQLGFQEAVTPVMTMVTDFHNLLLWIIIGITIFVFALLGIIFVRFNARANPVASTFTHNTMLEVIWTLVPIIILVVITIPSMRLLYLQDVIPEADFTVKATGYQWYWGYQYPDHGGIEYLANMVPTDELQEGQPRLLATDNPVVVPVGATVRLVVTAADVIHNWAMPAFGIKIDAVPGRINESWFRADVEGTYYGQCSELCGQRHAFMPIQVEVVSQEEFQAWILTQGGEMPQVSDAQTETIDVAAATQD